MIDVMEEEAWQKALFNHQSAKFNVMYAATVPEALASDRGGAIQSVIDQLRAFGGNGGEPEAPRRTHIRDRADIIAAFPPGITVRCPTEAERMSCEKGGTLLGFPLEGSIISRDCDGRAGECMMADGKCTDGLASSGLPTPLRSYADFMWQRSPFSIGDNHAVDGQVQPPGSDLSEPYWMARYYGYISEGADQVLAWRATSASCP
jgi:hypothetical protein